MNTERHGLFAELTPPPGGAERFAERVAADGPRRRGFTLAGAGAAVTIAFVAAIVWLREPGETASSSAAAVPEIYNAPEFDRLLGRPAQPTEFTVMLDERAASVVEVETANTKVRLYEIN